MTARIGITRRAQDYGTAAYIWRFHSFGKQYAEMAAKLAFLACPELREAA